jgi:ribosome-binding factor A
MSDRLLKINEAMRKVLAESVRDLSDPRIGFVTITGVAITRDLRTAKVFVSVLGTEDDRERSFAALRSSVSILQRSVAREVKMRNTPTLEFVNDDTYETATRIDALLEQGAPEEISNDGK